MTKVPEITLRNIDDVEDFTLFVDWLHHHMKGWNPKSEKNDCFVCSRCGNEIPFTEGGLGLDGSFKVDEIGWNLYVKSIEKKHELAICISCMKEVLSVYGMKDDDIENICMKFLPCYVKGENVIVKDWKDKNA